MVGWLFVLGCSRGDTATAAPSPPTQVPAAVIDAGQVDRARDAMPGGDAAAAGTCLAKTGCPAVPALPACPPGLVTKPLAEVVASRGGLLGKDIAVRGPLRNTKTFCTDALCRPG